MNPAGTPPPLFASLSNTLTKIEVGPIIDGTYRHCSSWVFPVVQCTFSRVGLFPEIYLSLSLSLRDGEEPPALSAAEPYVRPDEMHRNCVFKRICAGWEIFLTSRDVHAFDACWSLACSHRRERRLYGMCRTMNVEIENIHYPSVLQVRSFSATALRTGRTSVRV